ARDQQILGARRIQRDAGKAASEVDVRAEYVEHLAVIAWLIAVLEVFEGELLSVQNAVRVFDHITEIFNGRFSPEQPHDLALASAHLQFENAVITEVG